MRQTKAGVELIVVNDGSTDDTVDVLREYSSNHVQVIQLPSNVGVSEARMAGVNAASGVWVLFLDSDDELLPGAIETIEEVCRCASSDISRLAFMYIQGDGQRSPRPWLPGSVMDYNRYLRWSASTSNSDFSNCIRRSTFAEVPFPRGRVYETIYHLDFAKRYKTLCCGEVIAKIHTDAEDRLSSSNDLGRTERRLITEAAPRAQVLKEIIARHGASMERVAPSRSFMFRRALIAYTLLARERRTALIEFSSYIRRRPLSPTVWAVMLVGFMAPWLLRKIVAIRNIK